MKKLLIVIAIIGILTATPVFAGSYGGGFHSSGSYGGGFHSSTPSFHSYGGGFSSGSSFHSSGSFSTPHSTSSYSGGFSKPVTSTGTFKPSVSNPKVAPTTTTVNGTTYTTSNYNVVNHSSYMMYHPYAYYWNPFSANWFMWWWIFGNNNRPASENTTIINNCTPTKEVPCPATSTTTKTDKK